MESERDEELRVLFAAAEKGRADIINTVVEALAAKPKAAAAGRGATATATAIPASPEEAYADRRKLLSSLRESDGASALHVASMNGHVDAARALLRLGAAPEVKGTGSLSGLTAWDVAPTTVKQAYANDLFSQVACGEKSRAMALLKAGVRPNVTDGGPSADTPLHWAASFGHADLCSLLLNEGADVNRCNNEGTTPLHEACKGGHGDVVRLLLEQGADPQIAATGGAFKDKTPLQMSCSEAVSDIFRAPILHPAMQMLPGNGSSDGSNAAVGRTPGSSGGAPQRLAVPPPPPPPPQADRSVQTSHIAGVSNRRHSSIDSDIVRDSSSPALLPCPASGGVGVGVGGVGVGGANGGAGPSGPDRHSGTSGAGGSGGVSWAPSHSESTGGSGSTGVSGSGSGHHGVSNGGAEVEGERGARGVDRERPAPRPGGGFDGVDGHGRGGGGGGLGVKEEGKGEDQGRALPMLWPPPRACTVLRNESCLVPSQIVVVLPAGGVAGPGTLTLRTLLAAFASHGVEARCTRGRCPPGSGEEFFVALSCVTSWAKGGGGGGQGFSLVAGPGMVRVSGTGEPGLLYGVRTLCQILSIYASRPAKESALRIPCCIIRDEPDVSRRSLIVDVRYPLMPTLPSLMRTVEVASRARMNVVQLTVTRETASWLAGQEQHAANKTAGNDGSSEGGFSARTVGRDAGDDREEGMWGWGSLGELETFCREHFVELVLGWAVVAGDESRDAQRTTLQLLSSLSRQFQSDEIHITFDENVRLEWEGGCTISSDGPHRDGPPGPVISQNAGNVGGNPYTGARGGTQSSLNGAGVGAAEHNDRQAGGDSAGGGQGPPGGVLPRLSPLTSEAGRTPALSSGASAVASREEGLLLLTRFLSNVVVACGQGTIVLDGVPPAAIASLQGAGYLPVDLAFSLGGEALSDHRALGLLSGDGVIDGRSDELSMLLGPAYLGYVCTGHWGCIGGRREEACLSIHGALADVARGVSAARRVGCGVQIRPRAVLLPTPPAAPRGHATTSSAATTTTTTTAATTPGCSGANPYYPALLSDALTFLGGGLSWGLKKASAAANLSPASDAGAEEGSGVAGGIVSEEASRGAAGGGGASGDPAVEASLLQGKPSAALLLMTHLLRIDVEELETASAMQLCRCLEMLLEEWSPFSAAGGSRGPHYDEEVAIVRKMDAVLWGVHAPGGDGSLRFCVNGNNRFLLRSLQRRHLELQQVSKLAIQGLQASNAPCAGATRSWLMEVLRTARLLKLSGRFLQTICLHVRGPSPGFSIEHTPGDDHPPSPVVLSSPASGARRNSVPIHRRNSSENMPHFNWNSGCSEGVGGNEGGDEWTLLELVARLPVTVRLDVANRYLEEFRDLARAWNSAAYLPSGRALLHASLSGAMEILAHDTPAAQMDELCKSAIYNS